MAYTSYNNTKDAIDFVRGSRSLALDTSLNPTDSESGGQSDIIFAEDSATIITNGIEYGAYYTGSEVSDTVLSQLVGKLPGGKTKAYFEARPIRDILNEILFVTPTTITASNITKSADAAKQYTEVTAAKTLSLGTLTYSFTNEDKFTGTGDITDAKINNSTVGVSSSISNDKKTLTITKAVIFSDIVSGTSGYTKTVISNGAVSTKGVSGFDSNGLYYYVNIDGTPPSFNKDFKLTVNIKGKPYVSTINVKYSFTTPTTLTSASTATPTVTPVTWKLTTCGTIDKKVGESFTVDTSKVTPAVGSVTNPSIKYSKNNATISSPYSIASFSPTMSVSTSPSLSGSTITPTWTTSSAYFLTVTGTVSSTTGSYSLLDTTKAALVLSGTDYYLCNEAGIKSTTKATLSGSLTYINAPSNSLKAQYRGYKEVVVSANTPWSGGGTDLLFSDMVFLNSTKHNTLTINTSKKNTEDIANIATITLPDNTIVVGTPSLNITKLTDSLGNNVTTTNCSVSYSSGKLTLVLKSPDGSNITGFGEINASVTWSYSKA